MDAPLMPERMSKGKRSLLYLLLSAVVIFIFVTLICSFVYGSGSHHSGFIILALALVGFLVSTLVLLNWVRTDQFDDRLKYLTIFQSIILVFLCISILVVIYQPKEGCPYCPPQLCNLAGYTPAPYPNNCFTNLNYECLGPNANASTAICIVSS